MPYFIQERKGKYCVVKGTKGNPGETKKCHTKRKDALDHMAALYVHVEDARAIISTSLAAPTTTSRAGTAAGSTSNLPHGGGSLFGGTSAALSGDERCICPKCSATLSGKKNTPCTNRKCPECSAIMEVKSMDNLVKFLGDDRLGGYLVLWGSPDKKDLVGEYFTPKTDFWLDRWGGKRPLFYHHGRDQGININGKTVKLSGEDAVLGVIDTFKPDEMGLWVEAQLDRRHKYKDFILRLVDSEEGTSLSSGAIPNKDFIVKETDGYVKVWPIVEGSLTHSPCEHRMADVVLLKAAFNTIGEEFTEEGTMADERTMWQKFGEKLGLFALATEEEEEEAQLEEEKATPVEPEKAKKKDEKEDEKKKKKKKKKLGKEDDEDSEEEDDEEKDEKEEKKSTPTEFVLDESAIKAISTQVVSIMQSALAEAIVPLQKENTTLTETIKTLGTRMESLEFAYKHAEERAAEIIADAPPIIRVRASEIKATETNEDNGQPSKWQADWGNVVKEIVSHALKESSSL